MLRRLLGKRLCFRTLLLCRSATALHLVGGCVQGIAQLLLHGCRAAHALERGLHRSRVLFVQLIGQFIQPIHYLAPSGSAAIHHRRTVAQRCSGIP